MPSSHHKRRRPERVRPTGERAPERKNFAMANAVDDDHAAARDESVPLRGAKAFGYLPNEVVQNPALSEALLVVLAWRVTIQGE